MQQSCSQKTKERCFQQWVFSHQLVHSRQRPQGMAVTWPVHTWGCREQTPFPSRQAAPGGDNPASHLGQQMPADTALPWERRQDTLQSLFPGTTRVFTRFHSTAQEDSKPTLPCHHCQLTCLLCASVSPLDKNPSWKAPSELLNS